MGILDEAGCSLVHDVMAHWFGHVVGSLVVLWTAEAAGSGFESGLSHSENHSRQEKVTVNTVKFRGKRLLLVKKISA